MKRRDVTRRPPSPFIHSSIIRATTPKSTARLPRSTRDDDMRDGTGVSRSPPRDDGDRDAAEATREAMVRTLGEILSLDDREACAARLARSGWDLQRAVESALVPTVETDEPGREVGVRRRRPATSMEDGSGRRETTRRAETTTTRRPVRRGVNPFSFVLVVGVGIVRAAVKLSVGVVDAALRVVLPPRAYARFARPLALLAARADIERERTNVSRQTRAEREQTSEDAARAFSAWFSESFHADDAASAGVRFVQLSHRDALSVAKTETKLLFLYLHAPMHHESEVFCSQVLASPEVSTFVNDNFIAWGGSLRDGDAHALAAEVNPSAYPYVALLDSVSHGGGASLVMSCEGFIDTDGLIGVFEEALAGQTSVLNDARARHAEADANRRLREEQDAAFAESLARDAARAREAEEQRRKEEEERAREEEARRVEAEELRRREDAERERVRAIESRRVAKASSLREEPEEGAEGVSKLAIRLPDGSRAARRFHSSDTIADVYDFVDTLDELDEVEYSLISNFPRRNFPRGDTTSLLDAGAHPNGALFVQIEQS